MATETDIATVAARLIQLARSQALELAVAESLTGGAVAAALVAQPGASAVLQAAVVAYSNDMKTALLGVDAELLASRGSVDPQVALAMAQRVRVITGADVGLATTGVAGPEPHDGKPVGTVFIAVSDDHDERVVELALDGHREQIRQQAILEALVLASDRLTDRGGRA